MSDDSFMDRSTPKLRLGLPNTITLVRSLTVPGMVLCMLDGRQHLGACLYGLGAIADVIDAYMRRIGGYLQPRSHRPAQVVPLAGDGIEDDGGAEIYDDGRDTVEAADGQRPRRDMEFALSEIFAPERQEGTA